ncbi:MAG: vitamin K epoxide reductase family protein [Planctomycetota bacterium]
MKSSSVRKIIWSLVFVFSALGILVSYDLSIQHLKKKQSDKTVLDWACSAFATASCAEVAKSQWGRYPFGATEKEFSIPTAQLGLYYFTFVLCWPLLIGSVTPSRRSVHLLFTCIAALSLGACLYLDYVMFVKLDKWCPLCLTAHLCSLVIFLCAALLWPRRPMPVAISPSDETITAPPTESPEAQRHWPDVRSFVYAAIIVLLVINIQHLYMGLIGQKRVIETEQRYKDYYKKRFERYDNKWQHTFTSLSITPATKISIEGLPFRGPAKARHTVVIFSDFLCPTCFKYEQWFHKTIMPLGQKNGGLKFVFKPWPISKDCNPTDNTNLHPRACQASYAAEAARVVGGDKAFWKMYDLLWERQQDVKEGLAFEELAKQIGLNVDAFLKAMNSNQVKKRVRDSVEEGINLGRELLESKALTEKKRKSLEEDLEWIKVNSTPAVFVDGRRFYNPRHTETWKQILRFPAPKPKQPPTAKSKPATKK